MEERFTQDIREPERAPQRKGGLRWIIILLVVAAIAAAIWMYYDRDGFSGTQAAAVVNGFTITQDEFNNRVSRVRANLEAQGADFTQAGLLDELNKQVTEELINERLVLQDAEKRGITADAAELEAALKAIRDRFSSEEEFKKQLETGKMDEESWKESVRRELIVQKYIEEVTKGQNVTATDAEIKTFYDDAVAQQPEGQEIPKLADVKEQIAAQIQSQKVAQILQSVLAELKASSTIEVSATE